MSAPIQYRGGITREQWLMTEMRTVARLMLDERITEEKQIVEHIVANNSF